MAWPLYFRIAYGDSAWIATGWQAGVVDLSLLALFLLAARLFYKAVRFFVRGGMDED
jgi:hypothetical protein